MPPKQNSWESRNPILPRCIGRTECGGDIHDDVHFGDVPANYALNRQAEKCIRGCAQALVALLSIVMVEAEGECGGVKSIDMHVTEWIKNVKDLY